MTFHSFSPYFAIGLYVVAVFITKNHCYRNVRNAVSTFLFGSLPLQIPTRTADGRKMCNSPVPVQLDLNMKIESKFTQILPWNSLSLDCTLCNDNDVIEFWFSSDIVCLDVIMQNFFDGLSVEQSSTSFTFYAIYHSEHLTNHLFSFTAF